MIETNLKRLNTFNSQGYLVLDDNETKKKALNLKNAIREIMYKMLKSITRNFSKNIHIDAA